MGASTEYSKTAMGSATGIEIKMTPDNHVGELFKVKIGHPILKIQCTTPQIELVCGFIRTFKSATEEIFDDLTTA